jgi:type VI secretion system lysozyme-like protein
MRSISGHFSLLDDLVDDAPDEPWDGFNPLDLETIQARLRRDLENLLNTQSLHGRLEPGDESLEDTIVGYGLSDLYRVNPSDLAHRERLRREIERKISGFEPRLAQVQVFESEVSYSDAFRLEYRVEGFIRLDNRPVPISISARLNANDKRLSVNRVATGDRF